MNSKPFGKFTLDQISAFSEYLKEAQKMGRDLNEVLREAGPEKIKSVLGEDFAWYYLYELPFEMHLAIGTVVGGLHEILHSAAQSDDPQQACLDYLQNLDADVEWQGGFQGWFDASDLTSATVSIFKSMQSLMVYQKSLSRQVEEVRNGSDKALFDAVRIDRAIVACPTIANRICFAELQGDKKFFIHLKKALAGPSRKHMVSLDALRYLLYMLVDAGADHLSSADLEQIFVEKTKLYSSTPGAQKNLRKHYDYTKKKFNHRK
jgi:hypothetical protein